MPTPFASRTASGRGRGSVTWAGCTTSRPRLWRRDPSTGSPIWLGTFGDRALAVTGQLADGSIPSLGSAPVDRVTGLRDKIRAAAEAVGRDPDEITCAYHFEVDPSPTAPDEPWVVSGPVGRIAETLAGFIKLGFGALSIVPGGPDRTETVERLAAEIVPAVRELV